MYNLILCTSWQSYSFPYMDMSHLFHFFLMDTFSSWIQSWDSEPVALVLRWSTWIDLDKRMQKEVECIISGSVPCNCLSTLHLAHYKLTFSAEHLTLMRYRIQKSYVTENYVSTSLKSLSVATSASNNSKVERMHLNLENKAIRSPSIDIWGPYNI